MPSPAARALVAILASSIVLIALPAGAEVRRITITSRAPWQGDMPIDSVAADLEAIDVPVARHADGTPVTGRVVDRFIGVSHEAGTVNPVWGQVPHVVAMGNSQSGRFAKTFLNLGFNEDEQGRILPGTSSSQSGQLASNPNPQREADRALYVALAEWVVDGTMPPPSVYPRVVDGTLVPATSQAMGWPAIPGAPSPDGVVNPVLDYDLGPVYRYNDQSGARGHRGPSSLHRRTLLNAGGVLLGRRCPGG